MVRYLFSNIEWLLKTLNNKMVKIKKKKRVTRWYNCQWDSYSYSVKTKGWRCEQFIGTEDLLWWWKTMETNELLPHMQVILTGEYVQSIHVNFFYVYFVWTKSFKYFSLFKIKWKYNWEFWEDFLCIQNTICNINRRNLILTIFLKLQEKTTLHNIFPNLRSK